MTNIATTVTAILVLVTNSTPPRIVGSHPAGDIEQRQHQIIEAWQFMVPIREITNWTTLEIVPTNARPSAVTTVPAANKDLNAARKIAQSKSVTPQAKTQKPDPPPKSEVESLDLPNPETQDKHENHRTKPGTVPQASEAGSP